MKDDQQFEEYLKLIKDLEKWELSSSFQDELFTRMKESEQKKSIRWMAAASILALLFSSIILIANEKNKQKVAIIQLEQISKTYATITF
ncbi:hypothetical protein [Aquirufa sp. Wall-65K1]